MATVLRENIGLLNDKLTVQLSKEDYLPAFEKSLKTYAKSANIPGFRKGMVPASMVKKMYGKGVFTDEVLKTVESELNTYMQTEQLNIFAQPLPLDIDSRQLDMNNPADYSFAFEIGLKPALDINVNNINVTRYNVEVTDAMLQEEIDRLSVRHGKMTEPGQVDSDDNVLNLTFTEVDDAGNVVENGISKGNSLLVKYFSEAVRPQLIGKKIEDELVITLNEAFEEKERSWISEDLGLDVNDAGANDKKFKITITKVGLVEKPAMEETFFEAAFPGQGIATEDDFNAAVKQSIQQQWQAQSRNQLHDQIYHALVDHTDIEFPEAFLKRWIQTGGEEKKTAEQAEEEFPNFRNSLKWTLISAELMTKYDIKIDPLEIKAFARKQILGYMGVQNFDEAPWIDSYADNMLKDKKFLENTYYQLQTEKLFAAVENEVNITEEFTSPADLASKQHHHNH